MALRTKLAAMDSIQTHPDNVNEGDIGAIAISLEHHGQYRAIVVSEATGNIVAGNHTYLAAETLHWKKISIHPIPDLSPDDELRMMLTDNELAKRATYDEVSLTELLIRLDKSKGKLAGTGFDGDDLDAYMKRLDMNKADSRGALLAKLGDGTGAPTVTPDAGNVYKCGMHLLIVMDVFKEHAGWSPYIEPGDVFVPFPGPGVLHSLTADEKRLVLVQPDAWIAGHILDHWVEVGGTFEVVE